MSAQVPALQVGDWLDVTDSDGIWNVAQVLKLPTAETVEITYDCWGNEYNEEMRRDSDRIAPFHTHTWAVKCWAKLATWPWWPALLTVRAPGSSIGAQNLRLEESLLVDFLDKPEFSKRFRCWVKKSNIVAFQSRIRQKKLKMNGFKGDARSKNLALAMTLLTKCDAREKFPEFVEGTLPVQFEHNVTRPREEVSKEMGKEIWMRGFFDNRVNHAATHAYTPEIAGGGASDNGTSVKVVEKTDASATRACHMSQKHGEHSSLLDAETMNKVSTPKKTTDVVTALAKNNTTPQQSMTARKRARRNAEDDTLDNTDSGRAEEATSSRKQTQENRTKQYQGPNSFDGECRNKNTDENVSKRCTITKELPIEPRRYGKTPKKLKTARRSASKLPPYIPPYARLSPNAEPRNEEHTASPSYACHATQSRSRVKKGVSGKVLHASDQDLQQPNAAAMRRVSSCESKPSDESVSPINSRGRLTNATLRADGKLHNMKPAMEAIRVCSRTSIPQQEYRGDNRVRSLIPDATSETQGAIQEDLPLGSDSYDSFNTSGVPTFASRSSQPKYATQKLELALDDAISKQQGQNLSAATTPAELDAIKAELLRSPEVQAAITRMEHPSYGWAAPIGNSFRGSSSLSNSNFGCALKEVKKPRHSKYRSATGQSVQRPSQRSPSQQLRYDRESEAGSEGSQGLSTCSVLLGRPQADYSTFGFSLTDNFSMNQWYRDLYPKSFGVQQPW